MQSAGASMISHEISRGSVSTGASVDSASEVAGASVAEVEETVAESVDTESEPPPQLTARASTVAPKKIRAVPDDDFPMMIPLIQWRFCHQKHHG
jgi:hypothetical protein